MSAGGWTGGQLSIVRAALGAYVAFYLLRLVPHAPELFSREGVLPDSGASPLIGLFPNVLGALDSPAAVRLWLGAGSACALALAVGFRTRVFALLTWFVWACLHGRNPLLADAGVGWIGWLLLFVAALPQRPYGALSARGRVDPAGDWTFPRELFGTLWIVAAAGYLVSGLEKLTSPSWRNGTALLELLDGPLSYANGLAGALEGLPAWLLMGASWGLMAFELAFAPLSLSARWRPRVWLVGLFLHAVAFGVIASPDAHVARLLLHALLFHPTWLPDPVRAGQELVFYDGQCGLCHGAVRWLIAEDTDGRRLRFAPIHGEAFRAAIPTELQADLPDSILVVTAEGELLDRSRAVQHLCRRLGGGWRILAWASEVLPLALRDRLYDGLAKVRHRLFHVPDSPCPLLTPELIRRFDV